MTSRDLRRAVDCLLATLVLAGLLASPAIAVRARQADRGPTVSVRGRLVAMAGDPRTPEDGRPIQRYVVASRRGSVRLSVDAAHEPGLLAQVGRRVQVVGTQQPGGSVAVLAARVVGHRRAPTEAVTGSQKWVSLLCRFAGTPSVPHPKSWYDGLVGGSSSLISDYFEETSYGTIDLAGGTVMAWVDMPHNRSFYGAPANADLTQMAQDCATASNTAGLNFNDYMGIDMHFNENMTYSWGGSVYLSLDGVSRIWKATWMSDWGVAGVQAHEMGHGFGLLHSSGPYTQTYDSHWDQMSYAYAGPQDPTYGWTPEGTISYHRDVLGWFDPSWVTTVPDGGSKTVTLRPLSDPAAAGGEREIVIPVSATVSYTVEARERSGADVGVPGDAVVIHQVDESRATSSPFDRIAQVVDADGDGDVNDDGAMWIVGETFSVDALDLTVSVNSKAGDGSYQVSVAYGVPDLDTPTNPTSFASSSHTLGDWSADDTIAMAFSGASDVGTGVDGFSIAWGGAGVAADTTKDLGANATTFTSAAQPDGDRYVALRTVDEAGNWSDQIVAGPFRLDTTAPDDAHVDAPGSPFTWSTSIPVSWDGGADAGSGFAGYDVRSRAATAKTDFGATADWLTGVAGAGDTFVGKPGSTRCFSVRSADLMANRTAWSDEACTAVPLDDRAFVAKGPWSQQAGGTFQDTLTTASARGGTLTLKRLQARRFSIMATTCPTCGAFRVLWRGTVLAKVDLHDAVGASGVVFALGTKASVKAGTLVIEVTSRHKSVSIDAVGVTRV